MLDRTRAAELAAQLDLHVHAIPICLPCLTFVALPLDERRRARAQARHAALHADPVGGRSRPSRRGKRSSVHRLRRLKDAERAVADVEERGAKTTIARAIVHVLALQLVAEMHARLN